jgi:flagellar hook-associated protein 3 FlgL
MRVTPGMITAQLTRDLQLALAAIGKQQRMVNTGRRINAPADDPAGTARALTIRSRGAANEQFQHNINTARGNLSTADSIVRSAVEFMQQAKEVAIQGSNDTSDAAARQALGTQVDQILEAIVSLGNSRGSGGAMIFGGQELTVAPYTVTRDVNGKITAVAVNPRGIDGALPVEVTEGLTVAQGVPGTTVFGALTDPTNAFSTLIRLRDALDTNNAANVRAELDNLTTVHDRATSASVLLGTRLGWLDALESRLKDDSLGFATSLSAVEDADMAKVISDLTQIQTFYEASLAAGARLLQRSLADFLR